MRTAAVVCNVLVFVVTGLIVVTEGWPREPRYLALTLVMLFVPALSAVVLARRQRAPEVRSTGGGRPPAMTPTARAAVAGNLVMLGASGWEAVAQYPYAEGASVIPFAMLVVCTPVLSLLAFLGRRGSAKRKEPRGTEGGG
jgi:hypothetical protein